jgi:hypothetical protein
MLGQRRQPPFADFQLATTTARELEAFGRRNAEGLEIEFE